MHPRADDLLYFVLPFDLPCVAKGKAANLDITYVTYGAETPYRLSVYAEGKVFQYAFPARKWASECRWMSELLRLIAYNRKRL